MKKLIQKHSLLAKRYQAMANSFGHVHNLSEEQKKAMNQLQDKANEHSRKAELFKDEFTIFI